MRLFKIILNSPYFLVGIYIFRWHDIEDEIFLIQWRKFESKRNYIKKDMNL